MNINTGDKVFAKQSTWFASEGSVAEVTDVDNHFVHFTFDGNPKINCRMDIDTFNEMFEKIHVEEMEELRITEEDIDEIMANSKYTVRTEFDKCTVVTYQLPNGFVITESSACVFPEDYNQEIGMQICMKKIKDKIWELEAYRLQQYLWEESMSDELDCDYENCNGCFGCGDCDGCNNN